MSSSTIEYNNKHAALEILRVVPEHKQRNLGMGIYDKETAEALISHVKKVRDFVNSMESVISEDDSGKYQISWVDGEPFNPYFQRFWSELDIEKVKEYNPPQPISKKEKLRLKQLGIKREIKLPLKGNSQ